MYKGMVLAVAFLGMFGNVTVAQQMSAASREEAALLQIKECVGSFAHKNQLPQEKNSGAMKLTFSGGNPLQVTMQFTVGKEAYSNPGTATNFPHTGSVKNVALKGSNLTFQTDNGANFNLNVAFPDGVQVSGEYTRSNKDPYFLAGCRRR